MGFLPDRRYHQIMRGGGEQGQCGTGWVAIVAIVAALAVCPMAAHGQSTPSTQPAPRRMLDRACDALRRAAVAGPYGWGWASETPAPPIDDTLAPIGTATERGAARPKKKPVVKRDRSVPAADIDLRVTAASGLLLHLAGKQIMNDADTGAAVQAARAIAAVQLTTGQIPATARLIPKPAGHADPGTGVADRGPTCAGLAFMLVIIDAHPDKPDERITSAATRAATWLARQQTGAGGWQSAYPPGEGTRSRRLLRLDQTEYRDATLTLLLAARVLGRQEYALAAERSLDHLMNLRIKDPNSAAAGLWGSAYTSGGEPVNDLPEFPRGGDLLATRYAMETVLCAKIVGKTPALAKELAVSTSRIEALPRPSGGWERRVPLFPPATPTAPAEDAAAAPEAANAPETPKRVEPFDSVALARMIETLSHAQPTPDDAFGKKWAADMLPAERLAGTVCHLSESLLLTPLPTQEPPPRELTELSAKIWPLLVEMRGTPASGPPKR